LIEKVKNSKGAQTEQKPDSRCSMSGLFNLHSSYHSGGNGIESQLNGKGIGMTVGLAETEKIRYIS